MQAFATFAFGLLVLISIILGIKEDDRVSSLSIEELVSKKEFIGKPQRLEREFKIGISGATKIRTKEINEAVFQAVSKALSNGNQWHAPREVSSDYFLTASDEIFIFRDLYFDTQDMLLTKANGAIRIRYRWDSEFSYKNFLKGNHGPEARPTRVEIQSKTDRKIGNSGYSEVLESRLWFEKSAPPIHSYFEMGKGQLLLPLFIQTVKQGHFEGQYHAPAKAIADLVRRNSPDLNKVRLLPKLVVLTNRYRLHVNLVNPWGSGPNPNNTFIITIDRFSGQKVLPDLKLERQLSFKSKRMTENEFKELLEVEVEFEHNTSTRLDDEIENLKSQGRKSELARLTKMRELFLKDQALLVKIVKESLESINLKTYPVSESKYLSILYDR